MGRIATLTAFLIWAAWPPTAGAQSQAHKTGTDAAAGQEELIAVGALSAVAIVVTSTQTN